MHRSVVALEERWLWAWETLKLRGEPEREFGWRMAGYCAPHRRYHVPDHLLDGLEALDQFVQENQDILKPWELALVILAFFWHDDTWNTTLPDSDNVAKSALEAYQWGEMVGVSRRGRRIIKRLVTVTNHKTPPQTFLEQLIVCLDLSILGKDWTTYQWYGRFVRQEYPQYTDSQWQTGRPNFLETLAAHLLYPVPYFESKYEATAKENISREIDLLRSGRAL